MTNRKLIERLAHALLVHSSRSVTGSGGSPSTLAYIENRNTADAVKEMQAPRRSLQIENLSQLS